MSVDCTPADIEPCRAGLSFGNEPAREFSISDAFQSTFQPSPDGRDIHRLLTKNGLRQDRHQTPDRGLFFTPCVSEIPDQAPEFLSGYGSLVGGMLFSTLVSLGKHALDRHMSRGAKDQEIRVNNNFGMVFGFLKHYRSYRLRLRRPSMYCLASIPMPSASFPGPHPPAMPDPITSLPNLPLDFLAAGGT